MHISPRLSIFVLTIYNRKSAEVIGYLRGPFIISLLSCSTRKTCVGSICILKFRKAGINSSRVMHLLICSTLRLKSASFFTPSLIFLAALEISLFMLFLYYKTGPQEIPEYDLNKSYPVLVRLHLGFVFHDQPNQVVGEIL